ncbi:MULTISPECIES: peptide MFS transporter [Pasteurellaceae]|uniref:peptide MFS transporter n=1 Tax=Pasteurellaceae TaxID=712 RepID=UPI003563D431
MSPTPTTRTFFGHPFQLGKLFQIELWERFSFYGMQAILMMYLYYQTTSGGLNIDKTVAGGIVGAYGGSIYLATILGGWLSDRLIGAERTLFWSGVVVMSGHIALALLPDFVGLIAGLVLIAFGSGGVKASASSMVGQLYESRETRHLRDAGFSIFYIAINIGALLGPLLTGLLQSNIGFHYGFGAAAVGMAFGLWQYSRGRKFLPKTPAPFPLQSHEKPTIFRFTLLGLVVFALAIALGWLHFGNFKSVLLAVVILLSVYYFTRLLTGKHSTATQKKYIQAYLPLFLTSCIFWALWFQFYTVITIYIDETAKAQRMLGSFEIPVAWFSSLQGFWVIIFSGLLASLWMKMGKQQPKTPDKFAYGLIIVGVFYLLYMPFLGDSVMPLIVIALSIIVLTLAELLISPISLSFATKIAPPHFKTQMVALNFLSLSIGFTLGGLIFEWFYHADKLLHFYGLLGAIGIGCGVLLLVFTNNLNRMLSGID